MRAPPFPLQSRKEHLAHHIVWCKPQCGTASQTAYEAPRWLLGRHVSQVSASVGARSGNCLTEKSIQNSKHGPRPPWEGCTVVRK